LIPARLSVTPNPINVATLINYSVPKAGPVSIRLYDLTGSLVRTLKEGYSNAGSDFTTRLDASRLARGIYLLKFDSGEYGLTRKLILE
jgi:5-hydroxyisourate hydrolase-like protein (transthyretin family)